MSLAKSIHVRFKGFVLEIDEISFLDKGITAIVGPSGSGKTTLLNVLLGLEKSSGFSWEIAGTDVSGLPMNQKKLGVVFQNSEVFPHMTVKENLSFCGSLRLPSQLFDRIVTKLSLGPLLDRKASDLSGGERQRLALGNALIIEPRALILDEPFSSLDQDLRMSSRELVKGLAEAFALPVLMVTHDNQDVTQLAGRVHKMKHGRIVESVDLTQ